MARLIDQILGHEDIWAKTQGELPHALAFTGPSGIGKQKMAWAVAQRLLCTTSGETHSVEKPCGVCGACLRIASHQSESVLFIEPAGAQIKIESAHQVLEFLSLARLMAARVIIVNEAQLLNAQTANALLKVIEEPPPHTYFFLIVPEVSQLLPTLRSRSQVLRFQPLSEAILQQGDITIQPWMLKSARGSFERLATFRDEDANELRGLTFEFLSGAFRRERAGLTRLLEHTRDREGALAAVKFLQQGLRDWTVLDSGELMHADFVDTWRALPGVDVHRRTDLWKRARAMEDDIHANVERTLVFENFYYRSQDVLD